MVFTTMGEKKAIRWYALISLFLILFFCFFGNPKSTKNCVFGEITKCVKFKETVLWSPPERRRLCKLTLIHQATQLVLLDLFFLLFLWKNKKKWFSLCFTTLDQTYCDMSLSQCNMRSKFQWLTDLCNSHYVSQFAAFFIDTRAERSTVESRMNFSLLIFSFLLFYKRKK